MATRNNYTDVDAIKMLQGMEMIPNAGTKVASGKLGELTTDGLYTAAGNRGNLISYRYLEHLNEDALTEGGRGSLYRLWHKAQESKPTEIIGGVSEWRDHFVRLHHFALYVSKNIDNTKKYKNLDELLDDASRKVRKWHPDGTDMTRPEQYFRLIIPFYSWQRKAIPLILETLLTRPGRITAIPKAQFNIATMAGVNPDSLSDPFPEDQMFPTFLTDQMTGPQFEVNGRYYGVHPGFPAQDILNEWVGSNPLRSLIGMTSPFLRAPYELFSGSNASTGARINDYSEYIDSNTPLVGAVGRMTGYSPTGSILSLLSGEGLDPQYQIRKGNYEPGEKQTLGILNWLFGTGINAMSTDSIQNYAEIEKRNAARDKTSENRVTDWLLR